MLREENKEEKRTLSKEESTKEVENSENQEEEEKTTSPVDVIKASAEASITFISLALKVLGIKIVAIVLLVCAIFVIAGVCVTGGYYITAYSAELQNKEDQKKQNSTSNNSNFNYQEGKITFNNKNEVTINGIKFYTPIAIPENKNQFYALMTIRFAEAYRPDSTYTPNDFLSCGSYQQMTNELIGTNPKALTAISVLKDEYKSIISDNSVDILRWATKGYGNIQDGEIIFEPIYRNGVFVGWARTVPGMTAICKKLVDNHLKTGLFDRIALTRLSTQGRLNYINNYDLNPNNVDDFVRKMCNSQGPVDCGSSWNVRAKNALISALNSNLYESVKK
jgi:hypothetical protein